MLFKKSHRFLSETQHENSGKDAEFINIKAGGILVYSSQHALKNYI
jgi:hypothetical protein